MNHQGTPVRAPTSVADELCALIAVGGFWRLAAAWAPWWFYDASKVSTATACDNVVDRLVPEIGEEC